MKHVPIYSMAQVMPISNIDALAYMIRSLKASDADDLVRAREYESLALDEMNYQQQDIDPCGPTVMVDPSTDIGSYRGSESYY